MLSLRAQASGVLVLLMHPPRLHQAGLRALQPACDPTVMAVARNTEEQAARILGTRYTANPADPQPAADPSASSSSQLGEDGLSKGEHGLLQGRTAGGTKTVRTLGGESR